MKIKSLLIVAVLAIMGVGLMSAILPIWGSGSTSYSSLGIGAAIRPTFGSGVDTLKLPSRRLQVQNVLVQNAVDSLVIQVTDTANAFTNSEIWVSFRAGGGTRKLKFNNSNIGAPAGGIVHQNSFVYVVGNGRVADIRLRYFGGKYNIVSATVTAQ